MTLRECNDMNRLQELIRELCPEGVEYKTFGLLESKIKSMEFDLTRNDGSAMLEEYKKRIIKELEVLA